MIIANTLFSVQCILTAVQAARKVCKDTVEAGSSLVLEHILMASCVLLTLSVGSMVVIVLSLSGTMQPIGEEEQG